MNICPAPTRSYVDLLRSLGDPQAGLLEKAADSVGRHDSDERAGHLTALGSINAGEQENSVDEPEPIVSPATP